MKMLSLSRTVAVGALASLCIGTVCTTETKDGLTSTTDEEEKFPGWSCDELTPDLCDLEEETGLVDVRGGLTVKYWIYRGGPTNLDGETKLPIVMLHGGPAWPHDYMLPLKQQACRGRDVIFYDQAGCGGSALPPNSSLDEFPWLLDPAYYSGEELPAVLSHLGLGHEYGRPYHLLGSSWGTILAQFFVLDAATSSNVPTSLILSGPLSDAQSYIRAQWDEENGSLGSLPPFVQRRIRDLQTARSFASPEYDAIDSVLTTLFTCRTAPLPDCFVHSASNNNAEIYSGMQGPSEFAISGALGTFNTTGRLHEFGTNLPVLLTSGSYDTMRPSIVDTMEREIRTVERVTFSKSGHVSMIDEPGLMNDVVADFLDRVEEAFVQNVGTFVPRSTEGRWEAATEGGVVEVMLGAEKMPTKVPWQFVLVTISAFVVGLVVGNWNGIRVRREGYGTI